MGVGGCGRVPAVKRGFLAGGFVFYGTFVLAFGMQTLLQTIHALEKGLEHIGLGPPFFGHGIWRGKGSDRRWSIECGGQWVP